MASYPPPYPPPGGTPFGYDPRQQRQFLRQQLRSQKMAMRAQRDLYRRQTRSLRRSSIVGPLIVVGAGVILLLIRTGRLPWERFAVWYGAWWPAALVLAGLVLVAEWAFDHATRAQGVPYVRRGLGAGVVFLLILLALTGAGMTGFREGHANWMRGMSINSDNLEEFFGEKHEREQQIDQAFAPGTSLFIDNPRGDVTIAGTSTDNQIHITANKQVYSRSDADADGKSQQLSPRIELSGQTLNVTVPALDGATCDLSVTLPALGAATVNVNHGDIHVTSMNAGVTLTANHGDVEVGHVTGNVVAHINHSGSSFSAHDITGDVALRGSAQDLTLGNVSGAVSLEGEFYGDTHLEHLQSGVAFRTNRTQFTVSRLNGEVNISSDEALSGNGIVGPSALTTRSRNIALEGISGDLTVTNSNGPVQISDATPTSNLTIENRDGKVDVDVPEHAQFTVDAETRDGQIESDFPLSTETSNKTSVLRGTVGDGKARISIRTTHADVSLRKGHGTNPDPAEATPAPVAPPTPAAPPAAPPAKVGKGTRI